MCLLVKEFNYIQTVVAVRKYWTMRYCLKNVRISSVDEGK
jgi:hypothetical protein